jgi:hypothetical protein
LASTQLAAVLGQRWRGVPVSGDDQAAACAALEAMAVRLLRAGEPHGRGKTPAADVYGPYAVGRACPDT